MDSWVFLWADILIVTAIYQARENPIDGITAQIITDEAEQLGHKHVELIMDKTNIPERLKEIAQSDDMIITMGAGDIYKTLDEIYNNIAWIKILRSQKNLFKKITIHILKMK